MATGKAVDPETKAETLIVAFQMKGEGKSWDDIIEALGKRDDLVQIPSGTLRADYSKWKAGTLNPDVAAKIEAELGPLPKDDTHRKTPKATVTRRKTDTERRSPTPSDSDKEVTVKSNVDTVIHRQYDKPDLTEEEILVKVKAMLKDIEPAERPNVKLAKGEKREFETAMLSVRVPKTLVDELATLKGPKTTHVEKAVMLYLRALKVEG